MLVMCSYREGKAGGMPTGMRFGVGRVGSSEDMTRVFIYKDRLVIGENIEKIAPWGAKLGMEIIR